MNYTFQSFNFRGREKYCPFYDLICNIAAEEYSHIEAVACTINMLLNGATPRTDRSKTPMPTSVGSSKGKKPAAKPASAAKAGKGNPAPMSDPNVNSFYPYHFSGSALPALPFDGFGNPWNGSYVTATGNLEMDLLHNFFLECGARAGKARVYEMTDDPTARAMNRPEATAGYPAPVWWDAAGFGAMMPGSALYVLEGVLARWSSRDPASRLVKTPCRARNGIRRSSGVTS